MIDEKNPRGGVGGVPSVNYDLQFAVHPHYTDDYHVPTKWVVSPIAVLRAHIHAFRACKFPHDDFTVQQVCEMYVGSEDLVRQLTLNFFPFDNSVQVLDSARGRVLLRRAQLPDLSVHMLQVGNIVNIFSQLLLITDCAAATRRTLLKDAESTFALIKPMPHSNHGKVITYIMKKGFRIVRMKNGKLSKEVALKMYRNISGSSEMPIIVDYVTSGEVIGMELVAPDAVREWRHCLGATDPAAAAPGTLRALYGENKLKNVAHGSDNREDADNMLHDFFAHENGVPKVPFRATFKDCTCCVIKPHAVLEGNVGAIMEQISTSGTCYIEAMAMFSVNVPNAKEFYEVYKGVVPEYEAMAVHLAEGKCIALEVKCKDPRLQPVCELRKLCGPRDPELCRQLYPECIRAQYGKDLVHNAVHCTDLPEDGELEVEYFFKLLAKC